MNQSLSGDIYGVMPAYLQTGIAVSSLSVFAPSGTLTDTGAPDGNYVAVSGLQNIICQDAPQSTERFISNETNNQYENRSIEERRVLLGAYYSQLSPSTNWGDVGWRAVVDGVTYDIRAAESDSQRIQTRLRLRAVTV